MTDTLDGERIVAALARLRAADIRVHCLTNSVAQNFTANMLLALGVTPSMTVAAEEVPAFVAGADALLVNLGTLDAERRAAIDLALDAALEAGVPWVLDPVLVDRSPERLAFARTLIVREPGVVRVNRREFTALADDDETPAGFAVRHLTTLALTGARDEISDGGRRARVNNGHPLMGRVTAMGCAATAVVAALLAVEHDALVSAAAGLAIVNVAGEIAAETAKGPGSFAAGLLDALYTLDAPALRARLNLECATLSALTATPATLGDALR